MATLETGRRTPEGENVSADDPRQATPPKGVTKRGLLQTLGPGLVTGASDDDPSGIATYSQVGAQYGYGLLWTMLFSYPLMCGIQEISAQIGRVTGRGIAGNLRRHYAPFWLYTMVGLVLIANIINLGADIGAMGAAVTCWSAARPCCMPLSLPSSPLSWKATCHMTATRASSSG